MKVDEAFEDINRLWQEMSIIVVVHASALALAIYSHLIRWHSLSEKFGTKTALPELTKFRGILQGFGLDLPLVVGFGAIVYVIIFQRLSAISAQIPMFRLSYSQTALWRAGKCFDELRQLVHWFEGYTASGTLPDLEVTLELGITQYAKEHQEHFTELIGARSAKAGVWARYYSGFCVLALVATVFVVLHHPTKRALFLPSGLFLAVLLARCGWEARIEDAVMGRLRFAIDCGIISGMKRREKEPEGVQTLVGAISERDLLSRQFDRHTKRLKRRIVELELAAELVSLPPPWLPYQRGWLLHYVRQLKPFRDAGHLPLISNDQFRDWLSDVDRMDDLDRMGDFDGIDFDRMDLDRMEFDRPVERPLYDSQDFFKRFDRPVERPDFDSQDFERSDFERPDFERPNGPDILGRLYKELEWFQIHGGIKRVNDDLRIWFLMHLGEKLETLELKRAIEFPGVVPDSRWMARILWTRQAILIANQLAPHTLLVDERKKYLALKAPAKPNTPILLGEPLRKWIARGLIRRKPRPLDR